MSKLIQVKISDQYNNIQDVQALLRKIPENSNAEEWSLFQKIEHIIVDGEIILPSIELLFESTKTDSIYKVVE
ncbi:hypothetical protein CDG60_12145 [Acinetobacter chinensis]|jgi:hypothetical protein|uniref:Uncharacterized protein n=1 Tax=Acinetobacter chinensis TaxID=2004650 RepID=A0A3B7LXQ3_9GAMM|nr:MULTISPECIES: hypothetical protein [Acinetobacter]AXY57248.1 hypothetical protein CDG60_12145 [Acinetobacter chinensis]AXY60627.1 hypothetical protein CDG61_11685 [Acinetobacter sp. WCHAc010052]MDV2468583.1 hypothetical protein [Acinetobacter chinensis]WOE40547.1 hypothetical protein QSG87_11665 [Acinetobacter chinensis]